jgi:hypothetical protein
VPPRGETRDRDIKGAEIRQTEKRYRATGSFIHRQFAFCRDYVEKSTVSLLVKLHDQLHDLTGAVGLAAEQQAAGTSEVIENEVLRPVGTLLDSEPPGELVIRIRKMF